MTTEEMMRLQGMDPAEFKVDIPENELGRQIAMSVNVIERILMQTIKAIQFVDNDTIKDRWQNGEALQKIMPGKGRHLKAHAEGTSSKIQSKAKGS